MTEIKLRTKRSSQTRRINVAPMVKLRLPVEITKFRQKNFRRIISRRAIIPRKVTVTSIQSNKKVVYKGSIMSVKKCGAAVELMVRHSKTNKPKTLRASS